MIASTSTQTKNKDYDVIIENEINSQSYCLALLQKFSAMPLSHYSSFINYQLSIVRNQSRWLRNLEDFIHCNEATFKSKPAVFKYNKIFQLIERKQIEKQSPSTQGIPFCQYRKLINSECDDRYFSFYETKIKVEKIENFTEKIIHLTDEIFQYKQAEKYSINTYLKPYDDQCLQLIEHLKTIRDLRADFEKEQNTTISNQLATNKMRFNGNLNQLVDIFYQLNRELFVDGKSYIDGNTNDLVALIVNSFVDKDGKEISPLTVKTILKPSKEEKRPNTHKRIDIEKFL